MSEVISIINQKGGVGKTTTAINLAASLGLLGKKTLLIDFDPQANATIGLGIKRSEITNNTIYDAVRNKKKLSEIIISIDKVSNLYMAPTNQHLVSIEGDFYRNNNNGGTMLQRSLQSARAEFDFIIIDSAPTLGPLTVNVLNASDSVIIPVQCEYFALDGTTQLLSLIKLSKKSGTRNIKIRGFLPTMFTARNNLSKDVLHHLKERAGFNFFKDEEGVIVIPRNIKLAEASGYAAPICAHDIKSAGHIAYMRLANSLLNGA